MFGPIGSELMSIFRLLSPEEIDKYIVDNSRVGKMQGTLAAGGEGMNFDSKDSNLAEHQKEKFNKEQKAKIIPIADYQDETPSKKGNTLQVSVAQTKENLDPIPINKKMQQATTSQSSSASKTDLESIGVLSANTIKDIESKRIADENANKDSATVFLLKQRQKMRESKKKLIYQQAHKQYKTNAAQEFYAESDEDLFSEESQSDSSKGILVNKKHY